ncbi:MAG: peptidylprolyl isomerase [Rhodothermia bacterium]|nr:MAG: peptidylprolyl isomerase [Rhodothermia bacterium]
MAHYHRKRSNTASLFLGMSSLMFLVSLGCSSVEQQSANVAPESENSAVATIAGNPITLSEFVREYERTAVLESDPETDSLSAYRDFLERYVDFKLKVLEAKEAGYQKLDDFKDEIGGYRNQLARPYILQEEVTDPLIQLMHARRQEMIEASHILVRLGASATPADTFGAYERILAIRDSVILGSDFGELAFRYSEDPSARGKQGSPGYQGYLGTFGGGRMVDEFEDMAYATPVDSVSDPFRSPFGYHILKVHSRAPLPGDIRLAHIMVQALAGTAADSAAALDTMNEIKNKIAAGEDFADLAAEYSVDRGSASNGGELQRMAFDGGLPANLRDKAYSMEVGQISDVIETSFGFHLVRVLERFPPESLEEARERMSGNMSQLPRARKAEEAFTRQKRNDLDARVDSVQIETWFDQLGADSLLKGLSASEFSAVDPTTPIAWMGDSTYAVGKFVSHIRQNRISEAPSPSESFWRTMDDFLDDQALDYEIAALEERDPVFARTMNEFRDGLILFRLMEDSVWTAASVDSTGLEAFYGPRASSYRFEDRFRIIMISHASDSLLQNVVAKLRSGTELSRLFETVFADSSSLIRVDTTMIEGPSNSIFDKALNQNPGEVTDPLPYNNGFLILYNDGIEPAREKTFTEARAQAVNDYQIVLEEKMIARLRKKYKVALYPDRLQYLLKPGHVEP